MVAHLFTQLFTYSTLLLTYSTVTGTLQDAAACISIPLLLLLPEQPDVPQGGKLGKEVCGRFLNF